MRGGAGSGTSAQELGSGLPIDARRSRRGSMRVSDATARFAVHRDDRIPAVGPGPFHRNSGLSAIEIATGPRWS